MYQRNFPLFQISYLGVYQLDQKTMEAAPLFTIVVRS